MRKRWVAWKRQNEKQRKKMIKENVKRFWIKRQVVETQKRETDAKNGKQKQKDVCVFYYCVKDGTCSKRETDAKNWQQKRLYRKWGSNPRPPRRNGT